MQWPHRYEYRTASAYFTIYDSSKRLQYTAILKNTGMEKSDFARDEEVNRKIRSDKMCVCPEKREGRSHECKEEECYLFSVESFIRADSGPGGEMWSHGATTSTEWIQLCIQTYFLSLKLPARTALFHLEIHQPRLGTMFVMIVQLRFHMEKNLESISRAIVVVLYSAATLAS